MDIVKIIGIGLAGTVAAVILKEYKPIFALSIGAITATIMFILMLDRITYIFDVVNMIATRLSISADYIAIIIRIIGISYIARFGTELCRDAGQNSIAQKIELAGKVMIVVASIPILTAVLNLLVGILP
ncbi:MAG: stage III sporulation protein AD [Ruminococcaceae bacterium]|nr:stage III sporulation protein AD [Oscillospiraceae bacterium]